MKSSILEENLDENYEPTTLEINEYARFLGMDPEDDKELLWIARESLKAPLPENWKPCQTEDGDIYYFNFKTGESLWDHPCDSYYKELFKKKKEELVVESKQKKIGMVGSLPALSMISHTSTSSPKEIDQEEKKLAGLLKLKSNNSISALAPIKKSLEILSLDKPKLEQLQLKPKIRESPALDLERETLHRNEQNRLNVVLDAEIKEYEKEIKLKLENEKKRMDEEYFLLLDEAKKEYQRLSQEVASKNQSMLEEEAEKSQMLLREEKDKCQRLIQEEKDKYQRLIQEEKDKYQRLSQEEKDKYQILIQEEKERGQKIIQEEREKIQKLALEERNQRLALKEKGHEQLIKEEKSTNTQHEEKDIAKEIKTPDKKCRIANFGVEGNCEHSVGKVLLDTAKADDSYAELVQKCNQILDDGECYSKNLNELSQKNNDDDSFIQQLKDKLSHYIDKTGTHETTRNHHESKISLIERNDSKILEYLQKVKERNFLEASTLSR